ncbi:UDP-N-acetylmuramoyl-L-alanine--D-glutamate ligase [Alteromonas sp. CYL-A6]|uniref:UDP-N-acetylmuramoyl-L-alanine--D-glutamate ligase n=1 Tax=Alteromonas nitratireducens TaxID=3390813 RepID=UPI0034B22D99
MNDTLRDKKVVVAGLGLTGQACVRFLETKQALVKVWDSRDNLTVPADTRVDVARGSVPADYFDDVALIVVSPGISPQHPVLAQAGRKGCEVIGDVELFARYLSVPAVGITGSNGKTTVTLLTTHILRQAGLRVTEAGNVGLPVLDTLSMPLDAVVLELSSFQLEMTSSLRLQAATILNISDDHLDRHGSMEAYIAAKQRIYDHASVAIVWRGQAETRPYYSGLRQISIGLDEVSAGYGVADNAITLDGHPLLRLERIPLKGGHNVLNVQAAIALAVELGVSVQAAADAVSTFMPAPHRCVEIARHRGVIFIDDSKATNAGATLAAIEGLSSTATGRIILIAGGDAKGADLSVLKAAIDRHVSAVFAMGKDAGQFLAMTDKAVGVASMKQAVTLAVEAARENDIVLLSPACASLDMFDNYAHRARVFADAIEEVMAA